MNHIYRVVYNHALGVWQAVSEIGKGRKKTKTNKSARRPGLVQQLCALLNVLSGKIALGSLILLSNSVYANNLPSGGQVVGGQASISQNGTVMNIHQTTDKTAINWQSFDIGQGHTVNFHQPGIDSVALNRVIGADVSRIQGALNANGQVFLINPNGILFTPTSQINVGGLVASTLDIRNEDFLSGNYRFEGSSQNAIINQGNIVAANGGYVAMIAAKIENSGNITANSGSVLMGAGASVTLDMGGPVKIQVEQKALDALIENGGAIKADGGYIYLTAQAAGDLASTVINNTGIIEAHTLASGETGEIYLMGDMDNDIIRVAGTLDASAPTTGNGGFIETSAANVQIQPGLVVTTKAENGTTGEWLIDPNDYKVAASGGDITGTQLGTNLASTNVTIQSVDGGNTSGNGDIFVNDAVTWSSGNTLTLNAIRNIKINATIDASQGAGGKLALEYGQGAVASGNTATYSINAPVNLQDSGEANGNNGTTQTNFSTKLGSDGTAINYTVVNSQSALQAMNNSLNGNYALGSNLTFSGESTPIGSSPSSRFTGTFDGLGHTISNLTIDTPGSNYVGLFGYTSNATIQNIGLVNNNIKGQNYVGALVGVNASSTVTNSYATGAVTGSSYTGGLVGAIVSGTVSNSYATGAVTGSSHTGGLVAFNDGSTVTNSFWDVDSTGQTTSAGGTAIYSTSTTNTINAYTQTTYSGFDFTNTWWMVEGSTRPFLRMEHSNTITNAHQLQLIAMKPSETYTLANNIDLAPVLTNHSDMWKGTLVGSDFQGNWSPIGNSTTKFTGSFDGLGHTISNLTINSTSDFVGLFGYTQNATIKNVGLVNNDIKGNEFVGALVGYTHNSAVSNSYATGAVTGTDHIGGLVGYTVYSTVSKSYATGAVTGTDHIGGLVGYNLYSTVSNSYATGAVTGSDHIGGLVGNNYVNSTVNNSYATGTVTGNNYTGGLVGGNQSNSTVSNSYATGTVTGNLETGGLVGYNYNNSKVENSYATGKVTGNWETGGLVGYNASGSKVEKSYATGVVTGATNTGGLVGANDSGTVNNSFWDEDSTGQETSAGGEGKTTAELKNISTFNGSAGWSIIEDASMGVGYPKLAWQEGKTTAVWLIAPTQTPTPDPTSNSGSTSERVNSAVAYAQQAANRAGSLAASAVPSASGGVGLGAGLAGSGGIRVVEVSSGGTVGDGASTPAGGAGVDTPITSGSGSGMVVMLVVDGGTKAPDNELGN